MNGVIDLNVDVGEGFPWDSDLLALATSANVCCGVHAGSLQTTHATINECTRLGLRFGLHPGYNDRDSMGRAKRELADSTTQMGTLITLKTQCDLVVHAHPNAAYLKPHGAFYNQSAEDDVAADLLADILEHVRLPLMGLAYSLHQKAARRAEVPFISEGFIDRRVDDHGFLLPRELPNAMIADINHSVENALCLAPKVDSLCIHGDREGCVEMLAAVKSALTAAGFEVRAS